jgi:hypothetical protein
MQHLLEIAVQVNIRSAYIYNLVLLHNLKVPSVCRPSDIVPLSEKTCAAFRGLLFRGDAG